LLFAYWFGYLYKGMSANLSRHIVACISLLAFLFAGQTSVQGYVWCVAESGHAVLEYAKNNSCTPEHSTVKGDCHSEKGFLDDHDQDNNCSPCLDVSATIEVTSSRHNDQKEILAPGGLPVKSFLLYNRIFAEVLTSGLLSQPPPRVSKTLLAHRTVVLLN
jgi:hypothetical protein